jgi:hypothetical protein
MDTDTLSSDWSGINPAAITGFNGAQPGGGSGGVTPGVESAVQTAASSNPPLWSPQNPLFWFGAFLAAAGGLFHLSPHVKAGPLSGNADI